MTLKSTVEPDFKLLFEHSPRLLMVVLPDRDFTIIAASNAFLSSMKKRREDLIGKSITEAFPDLPEPLNANTTADLRASFERVIATGLPDHMTLKRFHVRNPQTGEYEERHWSPTCLPIFNEKGKLAYISHQVVDVTEFNLIKDGEPRQRLTENSEREIFLQSQQLISANERLKESEESLRLLFENSLDAVVGMTEDGVISHWNSQAEKTFGWSKEEAIGQQMSDLLVPRRYRLSYENRLRKFLITGLAPVLNRRLELTALIKSGIEIPIELSVTSVKTKGSFVFYGVVRDISERLKSLEALRIAKEAAESANYAKSAFLANMSHELRTPLGAVLGFSELLIESKISKEEKASFVKSIRRNGELLSNIINDILDLSKVEAEKLTVESRKTLIPEIINDLEAFMTVKAAEKGLRYSVRRDANVPRVIRTDPLRLRQILLNIVGNAIKFTSKGSVDVRISLSQPKAKPPELRFTVTDSGIGIDENEARGLFQSFTQADPSMKRRFGGVGLGLVISKRLAQLLEGDVRLVKSTKGKGSVFEVVINPGPLVKEENQTRYHPPKLGTPATKDVGTPVPKPQPPRLKGIKILLVDDSIDNQVLVTHLLKLSGAQVVTADNGKVAVEKAHNDSYDIILMDLQMPVMDGFEATNLLRTKGYRRPIIALTAHASDKDREHCLESGFDDHISKPVHRNALLNGIAEICGRGHDLNFK